MKFKDAGCATRLSAAAFRLCYNGCMDKGRLEAFSDSVIAVIITIMVLNLKVPAGGNITDLRSVGPVFCSYAFSFMFVAIYWNNHHHLLQAATRISGGVLWANLHLLFWLSFAPFGTAWIGAHPTEPWPCAVYGILLLLDGVAYTILARALIKAAGPKSILAHSIGSDPKENLSLVIYVVAIPLAFVRTWLSGVCWMIVAFMWLLPDRRIERVLQDEPTGED
ncbi:MAG: TMEM175 family protein [Terracidiphilus sp.]